MLFMYFWLNYCDENYVERIPIAMEKIGHLFHLASQIIKADRLNLLFPISFCFLTVLELMRMNS